MAEVPGAAIPSAEADVRRSGSGGHMTTSTETQATKALEWVVERINAAQQNGYWMDRLAQVTSSKPAYLTALTGGSSSGADDARAARAEAAVQKLSAKVADLEAQIISLNQRHEELAQHLEDAVGPQTEGDHKTHWWSRKH